MKDLIIEKTSYTPTVKSFADEGIMIIKGRLIPFEGYTFFKPILDWVHEYIEHPQEKTQFRIFTDSANTTSAKAIMMIFKDLDKIRESGYDVEITWYFDDEDDLEDWKSYTEFFEELSFEFIKVDEEPDLD